MTPIDVIFLSPIKAEDRPVADPFTELERQGLVRMKYMEFRLLGQASMILKGREHSPWSRVGRNLAGLVGLFLTRGRVLLIGTEPFRMLTLAINHLKSRHRCLYHTSWSWGDETLEERTGVPNRKALWQRFLKDLVSVSFTPDGAEGLARYGARAFFIPHTVDCEIFRPRRTPREDGEIRVLFVGHLVRMKGVHLILNVLRSRDWSGCRFQFLGQGPLQEDIRDLAARGYPVESLGIIRDREKLAEVYRESDFLVLPSVRMGREEERFGMVLIEAMASGLPVLASDCVGPRQIVEHGVTGLLIPQNDERALRESIEKLAGDARLRAELGRNGRRRAEEVYDKRVVARQWLDAIRLAAGAA